MPLAIPALAISNALLFADPTFSCLSGLGEAEDSWRDAVVLSTRFWLPRTGKLNRPLNLTEGISPLLAASIRFDPDREVTIATEGFSPDAAAEAAKNGLAAARCVKVFSSFPHLALPAVLQLMPDLVAVHLGSNAQLTACMIVLTSLEGLRELRVNGCFELRDLSALAAAFPALHTLGLVGCSNLKDISAMASMKNLRELSLRDCPEAMNTSVVETLPLSIRDIHQDDHDPWQYYDFTPPRLVPLEILGTCVDFLRSDYSRENMQGTIMIRKMLCVDSTPPLDKFVAEGCVSLLAAQLARHEEPKLQFESAWALSNIATEENTGLVLNVPEVVPNFVGLLDSPDEECRCQACWGIGNLAGDGADARDVCLDAGALPRVLAVVTDDGQAQETTRNAGFALQNLCRYEPFPKHDHIAPALPILVKLLNHEDEELVVCAVWAFKYLSDDPNDGTERVLDAGCLPRLVELLGAGSSVIVTPAISIVGDIATGDVHQTQALIDAGALSLFHNLLSHSKHAICKEACWTLSNITAGGVAQIQAVIDEHLIPALINATVIANQAVKKEATWALANAIHGGSDSQFLHLVQLGVLPCLCEVLRSGKGKKSVFGPALNGIKNVLQRDRESRRENGAALGGHALVDEVTENGAIEVLQELVNHPEENVAELAKEVIALTHPNSAWR